jgi:hypothetical protein
VHQASTQVGEQKETGANMSPPRKINPVRRYQNVDVTTSSAHKEQMERFGYLPL